MQDSHDSDVFELIDDFDPPAKKSPVPADSLSLNDGGLSLVDEAPKTTEPKSLASAETSPEDEPADEEFTRTMPILRLDIKMPRQAERAAPAAPVMPPKKPKWLSIQLKWSVLKDDIDKIPKIDIFREFTLYIVENAHNGRRWYALRLGFFSSPEAARQIVKYISGTMPSVSIIPITQQEKDTAESILQK